MCNLYSMTRAREAVVRLFRIADNRAGALAARPAIFPGHEAPIVRRASDGERELVTMNWGFVLQQKDRAPRRVTNARDDTVQESRFWRQSFEQRRCLVPASSFAEPRDVKPATWHWFALTGEEPRPLFAFAGIWRRHRGAITKRGQAVEQDVFAFMTTLPNALVATINHERMPVLLTEQAQFETWLTGTARDAFNVIDRLPADRMRIVQAGFDKADLLVG